MKDEFKSYTAENFADDSDFINWVKNGQNNELWEKFIVENPHLQNEIQLAWEIILSFNFKKQAIDVDFAANLKQLEQVYDNSIAPKTRFKITGYVRYVAAIAVLMVASVAFYHFFISDKTTEYEFSQHIQTNEGSNTIQLVLANGKKIQLSNESKELKISADKSQISVDESQVIENNASKSTENHLNEVSTPYGFRLSIVLSDGTTVWLNAGSKLVFPQHFDKNIRKVFVTGEAYFKVAKNKKVPFVVNANQINLTVLGTEFNINNRVSNTNLDVVLVEGSVKITDNNKKFKSIKLSPNQRVTLNKTLNTTKLESNVDVDFYSSWKDGYMVFDKHNLHEVLGKLSEYYNVKFTIDNGVETNRKITGKLELNDSFSQIMEVVSDLAFLNYQQAGNEIIIKSKSNKLPIRKK